MRRKILIYLIIIAGFITSCTRDSTELNSNNQETYEGKEFTAHFWFTKSPISIEEEPLGARPKSKQYENAGIEIVESSINNEICGAGSVPVDDFGGGAIGIQITEITESGNKIIAGGLFNLADWKHPVDISAQDVKLTHGIEYIIETTFVSDFTDAMYGNMYIYPFYITKDDNPYMPVGSYSTSFCKDWTNPKELFKFFNLQQTSKTASEFTIKNMYYGKKTFTADFENPKINLNLDSKSYRLKVILTNLPDGYSDITVNADNYLIPLFKGNTKFSSWDKTEYFPTIHGTDFISNPYTHFSSLYVKVKEEDGTETIKSAKDIKFEPGKFYTIKADFTPPAPIRFLQGGRLNEYFNNHSNCYVNEDRTHIINVNDNFKNAFENKDDYNEDKAIVVFSLDRKESPNATGVLDIKDNVYNYNTLIIGMPNDKFTDIAVFVIDKKFLPTRGITKQDFGDCVAHCDDAFIGDFGSWFPAKEMAQGITVYWELDEKTRHWVKI